MSVTELSETDLMKWGLNAERSKCKSVLTVKYKEEEIMECGWLDESNI